MIGIVTVPAAEAQTVVNTMVLNDIRAIWDFTPAQLDVPASVVVENVRLSESLAVLTYMLGESLRQPDNPTCSKPCAKPVSNCPPSATTAS